MIESILYKIVIYCRLFLDVGSVGESGNIQTQKIFNQKMWYIKVLQLGLGFIGYPHVTIHLNYVDEFRQIQLNI